MTNPLIIPILGYLREQNSACSLIDLMNLCKQDLLLLVERDVELQIVTFQKNFFIMNALYQIQREIQSEGFTLTIFPLDICIVPILATAKEELITRDTNLARYYLDWTNLNSITVEEVDRLFSSFWQKFRAVDKIDAALTTLGLAQGVDWSEIRQAYKKQIAISHPDKGGRAEDFIEIRTAFEVLSVSFNNT